jgi:hypothetical protein
VDTGDDFSIKAFYHIMRARKYNKRIELWQTTGVSGSSRNQYGGSYSTPVLITKTWCRVITLDRLSRSTDFGITDTNDTIIIELRKRNDLQYNSLNQFFRFNGNRWNIQGTPINKGFDNREIQITLKRESIRSADTIEPIQVNVFDNTFDNTFN